MPVDSHSLHCASWPEDVEPCRSAVREAYVIAVAGASGAGKTTLVRNVAELLGDATTFFFDDYCGPGCEPPDLAQWLRDGADPDAWMSPHMGEHLRALRRGEAVTNPRRGTQTAPAPYIVMEEPFGRARAEVRDLVDFVVCIDLPLEIALARRVLRTAQAIGDCERFRDVVRGGMKAYLNSGRETYLAANRLARAACELVVDGTRPADELAREVVAAVRERQAIRG